MTDHPVRPKMAITGPDGFVAWHVRCAARARWGRDLIGLGPDEFADPARLDAGIASADAVIHLAGVNRAADDGEIERVNPWLAEQLVASFERTGRVIPVVYGNSIHSLGDSVFGVAKRRAASVLAEWGARSGASVVDVVMPNIFGEHGVPHYNSVIATFSHLIARGETPTLVDDKELPLVHVQRVADVLLDQALAPTFGSLLVEGTPLL
ncbi:MAG TPA: capsule biosynthesis protein CapF, partial [Dermatophilaceae bacterium]|nr:capsule biosynthesis protein CapF [Dermatophilaceae bacterium]